MAKKVSDKKRAKCLADLEQYGLKKAAKMNRVSEQAIRNWDKKRPCPALPTELRSDLKKSDIDDMASLAAPDKEYDREVMEKLLFQKIHIQREIINLTAEIKQKHERLEQLAIENEDTAMQISRLRRGDAASRTWIRKKPTANDDDIIFKFV